jgi:hypothetical protein
MQSWQPHPVKKIATKSKEVKTRCNLAQSLRKAVAQKGLFWQ